MLRMINMFNMEAQGLVAMLEFEPTTDDCETSATIWSINCNVCFSNMNPLVYQDWRLEEGTATSDPEMCDWSRRTQTLSYHPDCLFLAELSRHLFFPSIGIFRRCQESHKRLPHTRGVLVHWETHMHARPQVRQAKMKCTSTEQRRKWKLFLGLNTYDG